MNDKVLQITILGLSLSSSWGNGHATTYRALIRGLHDLGHKVTFLERNVPWYAAHRDLTDPDFCALHFYEDLKGLRQFDPLIAASDLVIVGSYVPDGVAVIDHVLEQAAGCTAFYDIDTPVTLATLGREEDAPYLARRQISQVDLYLSFTGGPILERLKLAFGARRASQCGAAEQSSAFFPDQPGYYRPVADHGTGGRDL